MGLRVYVCKPKRAWKKDIEDESFISMYDEKNDRYSDLGFPSWALSFQTDHECEFYDWKEYKERKGIDIRKCKYIGETATSEEYSMTVKCNGQYVTIDMNSVKTYKKPIKVVLYSIVSQIRGVFNEKLYDDIEDGRISRFVWTVEELRKFMEEYCQEDDNGYSFKDKFKNAITDFFEEGKTFVYVDW